jgi:phage terminase large subunit-like protein
VRTLSGFTVDPASETGDKLTRFRPFSSQCRAGNVKIRRLLERGAVPRPRRLPRSRP